MALEYLPIMAQSAGPKPPRVLVSASMPSWFPVANASEIVIDHHSRIGPVPRQDPEIVFPMIALANLAARHVVGSLSPFYVSFKGGIRRHEEVEKDLAPAIGRDLKQAGVDLALLVPY